MSLVRNNHDGRLTVGGVSVRPGAIASIMGWSPEVANPQEKALLGLKKIEVVAPTKVEEKPSDKKSGR